MGCSPLPSRGVPPAPPLTLATTIGSMLRCAGAPSPCSPALRSILRFAARPAEPRRCRSCHRWRQRSAVGTVCTAHGGRPRRTGGGCMHRFRFSCAVCFFLFVVIVSTRDAHAARHALLCRGRKMRESRAIAPARVPRALRRRSGERPRQRAAHRHAGAPALPTWAVAPSPRSRVAPEPCRPLAAPPQRPPRRAGGAQAAGLLRGTASPRRQRRARPGVSSVCFPAGSGGTAARRTPHRTSPRATDADRTTAAAALDAAAAALGRGAAPRWPPHP